MDEEMKPAGVIVTYIDWRWKQWWFNIPLFLFQLTFMVVGTAIGKIKWPSRRLNWIDVIILWAFTTFLWLVPRWWNTPLIVAWLFVGFAIFRGIDWAVVWRAAQASHVRLCLQEIPVNGRLFPHIREWQYINFGYPKAEIQSWRPDMCKGRFKYRDPTFTFPQKAIDAMIEYAEGEVGKPYDKLQLLSPAINFAIWIFWWPLWGKEKIRWANQPGGAEFCSSGVTACLQWGAKKLYDIWFFFGYDTAMVMPCMFVISEKWRKVK